LPQITIGKEIKIFRKDNDNLEYEGIIAGPLDKDRNPVMVESFNRGLLIDGYKTPWSFEFENLQFDDLITNELFYEYRFIRANTLDNFDEGTFTNTATLNVVSGTTPSDEDIWLILATTQASPTRFVSHGTYISEAFDLKVDAIDQVTLIDLNRVRYQATVGQTGDITVKVRYAADDSGSPDGVNWKPRRSSPCIATRRFGAKRLGYRIGQVGVHPGYPDCTVFLAIQLRSAEPAAEKPCQLVA